MKYCMLLLIALLTLNCSATTNTVKFKPKQPSGKITESKPKANTKLQPVSKVRELAVLNRQIGNEVNWSTLNLDSIVSSINKDKLFFIYIREEQSSCIKMETNTLREEAVIKLLNDNFISIKLSSDGSSEEKFQLSKADVQVYPTIFIITPSGLNLLKIEGVVPPLALSMLLTNIVSAWQKTSSERDVMETIESIFFDGNEKTD